VDRVAQAAPERTRVVAVEVGDRHVDAVRAAPRVDMQDLARTRATHMARVTGLVRSRFTSDAVTLAFFDVHLRGEADAAKRLSVEGLKPLLRGSIDKVEVLSK